jgi:maltooligosyltrehalose trehalohydrolase
MGLSRRLGATYTGSECQFLVWSPRAEQVEVHVLSPADQVIPMVHEGSGYYAARASWLSPGARYKYRLNGSSEFPDPASRFQPEGVHGPSQVVTDEFPWTDHAWTGLPLHQFIIYELHVGTFSTAGTFDGVISKLDYLAELGVTAIQLMPVGQFPGSRNWGYDGVYPFAVQNSYGGPEGLKRLVDAAHQKGLAVLLDVVYNHLGPEGNYLSAFGPYFTDAYHTPWGSAVNFDQEGCEHVRRFFVENACYWIEQFHIDGLRLDAVHAIFDASPRHILEEISDEVHAAGRRLGRRAHVIAESDLNDARLVRPKASGGMGMDAQWSDDFHHALHVLLTHETAGYYADFESRELSDFAKAMTEGYVYTGQESRYRNRRHGTCCADIPADRFVVCAQNHDQIGNRMLGERLGDLAGYEDLKLAAGAVLLSPFIPLLFMGEEYGDPAPFLYFVSHGDPALIKAVRDGRRNEFAAFRWRGEAPDPQDERTFERSRLDFRHAENPRNAALLRFYRALISFRRSTPAARNLNKEDVSVTPLAPSRTLVVRRRSGSDEAAILLHFNERRSDDVEFALPPGSWRAVIDSADARWLGGGSHLPPILRSDGFARATLGPRSIVVLHKESA